MAIKDFLIARWWYLAIIVVLIAIPFIIPRFWTQLATEMLILALFSASLNLLLGYGGMLSFGQAAYYGVGAYTVSLLLLRTPIPLPVAFILAAVMSAVVGAALGFFCVRLKGFYFAILTLAFGQLIWSIIWKWRELTGGDDGLTGLRLPALISTAEGYYIFTLLIVGLCILALWMIVHSPFGLTLRSIRENAERTEFIGVNVTNYRLVAFVIAAFFSGIAGILFALYSHGASPGYVNWTQSGNPVMATILGGVGTFFGPVVGAVLMILLDQLIGGLTPYWPFFLGTSLLLLVLFLPGGVYGFIQTKIKSLLQAAGEKA